MSTEQPDDPLGRLRAEMDQAKEGVREFAQTLWAFYDELITQGFGEDQALVLVLAFLTESMNRQQLGDDE